VEEWNRQNPRLRITAARESPKLAREACNEPTDDLPSGDYWLGELNRHRGMMQPVDEWPAELQEFGAKWSCYKASNRLVDFCDLIEIASRDIRVAPGCPDVIFADEAQDLNPMQLALVRRWGEEAQYFVVAADDDQTIYSWCGASPDAVLDPPIPEDHKIILKQSHRVPQTVHARANRLIHQVSRRQEKDYHPRPEAGSYEQISGGYKSPEYRILKTLMQHLERGQKVMLLASCSHLLHPLIAVLRQQGVPFHNPFRKSEGFWNQLRHGRNGSSVNRILALLAPYPWTVRDLKLWTEWLSPKGTLRPGAKEEIQACDDSLELTTEHLNQFFEAAAFESLLAASADCAHLIRWWSRRVAPTFHGRVQFPVAAALAGGRGALEDPPRVIVGTIHSVKGGEADVVYLFPDLSPAGDTAYRKHGRQRDSVIRLFYVGMTRARHTLYVCQRESPMAVTI
jgi:DNA helicase-2/ATP-dependent DNA helicase PcrA